MKHLTVIFILSIIPSALFAQFTNIEIDNSNDSDYLSEPFISFNINNPDEILVGTNLSYAFYSHDGAYTWTKVQLESTNYGVYGDPCVINDNSGNFYFFHLSDPPPAGGTDWIDRIVCQKSVDAGISWEDISYTGLNSTKKNDKQTAVFDRSSNNIYLTWSQFDAYHSANPLDSSIILFSSSMDTGNSWSPPVRISKYAGDSNGGSGMLRSAVPCIGPAGEIYIAWAGKDQSGNLGIIFDKSTDQGLTWLDDDLYVCDFPGGSHFDIPGIYPGMGAGWSNTACDTSGTQYNGNIYINWADQRNGTDDTDIWIVKSDDGGNNWTSPLRVNNDPAGKHQFHTWMTIDQISGFIDIIFYDRRNYNDLSTDVYLAVSEDGGETFSNTKISSSPFIPSDDVFFGDYSNIIAYNGMIRPVWTRLDGGVISINTAIIEAPVLIENIQSELIQPESFPNPFKDEIYFSFKLRNTCTIDLKFCDIFGREIHTLISQKDLKAGKYVETFNARKYNLNSGIYYFVLKNETKTEIKKVIYIK